MTGRTLAALSTTTAHYKVILLADNGSNTTPQQAMTMLEHAWQAGVQIRWIAGDKVYGDSTDLRDLIARQGLKPGTGTPAQLRL
jgi:hypothetical protein